VAKVWITLSIVTREAVAHAQRAGLPADEVIKVADTVLVRPDPEKA
jgi:3-hydroxyisobutyrate dehydrogenase-like beta-hydroxyacid dehydrogenase